MMKSKLLPMNLQFFAEPQTEQQTDQQGQQPETGGQGRGEGTAPEIDYNRIQQMLDGTLAAKENTALKSYFKQQGLTQEEAEQAIKAFKQQKAENTPDVAGLQSQLSQAQDLALRSQMENKALLMHKELGVSMATMPYVMKLADFKDVLQDGKINEDKLKEALNSVLEAVPQLKEQKENQAGFRQVGAGGTNGQAGGKQQPKAIPSKPWNRWN